MVALSMGTITCSLKRTRKLRVVHSRTNHCVGFVQSQDYLSVIQEAAQDTKQKALRLYLMRHCGVQKLREGYRYVLAYTEHATKWCYVFSMKWRYKFPSHFDVLMDVKLRARSASIKSTSQMLEQN